MNFSFKQFLPKLMKETRWGELIEVWQSIWEDIKKDRVYPIFDQYDIEKVTEDDIKNLAIMLGFNLLTLDGYTSSYYFMLRELKTIVPRLITKTTPESYLLNGIPFNLISTGYSILKNFDLDKLQVEENLQAISNALYGTTHLDREDEGNIGLVFNTFYDRNLIYDKPKPTLFDEMTMLKNPPEVILPPSFLDSNDFLMLDGSGLLYSLTRNFIYSYIHKFVENEIEFMSINTLTVLLNDLHQNKRLTDRPYFEPFLIVDVEPGGIVTEKIYTDYHGVELATQRNAFIRPATNFNAIETIRFGNGSHTVIDSSITDVKSFVFEKSWKEWVQEVSRTGLSLEFRLYIEEMQKFPAITEMAIIDLYGKVVIYTTFPKIQWNVDMYSNLKFRLNITGLDTDTPVRTPIATPSGGIVLVGDLISLFTQTLEADIWYTIDGSTPIKDGLTSILYTNPYEILLPAEFTLKAIAVRNRMLDSNILETSYIVMIGYLLDLLANIINTQVINYGDSIILSAPNFIPQIESPTVDIYYTIDGDTPDETSFVYTTPIVITQGGNNITIKAIGKAHLWFDSNPLEISFQVPIKPYESLPGEWIAYGSNTQLLSNSTNGSIRYNLTTDGSTPDIPDETTGTLYTSAIVLTALQTKINATTFVFTKYSEMLSVQFLIPSMPISDVNSGWTSYNTSVNLSTTEGGTPEIRYTDNGINPTLTNSTLYISPLLLQETTNLKIITVRNESTTNNGIGISDVLDIQINIPVIPTSNIDGDLIDINFNIILQTTTVGGKIYYTLDGSHPDETSTEYTGQFRLPVSLSTILKAITVYEDSSILYYSGVLTNIVEVLYVSPMQYIPGGTFIMGSSTSEPNREEN